MRIFLEIIGKDDDADRLFTLARGCAKRRVVVKRPKLAPHLCQEKPDIQFIGQSTRFDVYLNSFFT